MSLKIKHGNFTDADRKKAVNHAFSLVRKGDSITKARKFVANELGVNPNTLWFWQDKLEKTKLSLVKSENKDGKGKQKQSTPASYTKRGDDHLSEQTA